MQKDIPVKKLRERVRVFIGLAWIVVFLSFTSGSNQTGKILSKGSRIFGSFKIEYEILHPGYTVNCTLRLENELVGLSTINGTSNRYVFDVFSGSQFAEGNLNGQFYPPNQFSTLEGDFKYGMVDTSGHIAKMQRFKGTIGSWFTIDTTENR